MENFGSIIRKFPVAGCAILLTTALVPGKEAKRVDSTYEDNPNVRHWIKIKNPAYSQKKGRGDLFKRAG